MKKNLELLRAVRDQIWMQPGKHWQSEWGVVKRASLNTDQVIRHRPHPDLPYERRYFEATECGTAACVAGWATQLHGDRFLVNVDASDDRRPAAHLCRSVTGQVHSVEERARELLGLEARETWELFAIATPRKRVLEILDGYIKEAENAQ